MDDPAVLRRGDGTDVVVRGVHEADDVSVPHPVVYLHLVHELVVVVINQSEVHL